MPIDQQQKKGQIQQQQANPSQMGVESPFGLRVFFFRPRASVLPAETTDFRLNHASFGRELHFGRRGFQPLVFFEPTLRVMIFDVFIGGKTCHDR